MKVGKWDICVHGGTIGLKKIKKNTKYKNKHLIHSRKFYMYK